MFKRLYEKTMEQGKKEEGQGLAEVALFLALVVVVAATVLPDLGAQIAATFTSILSSLGG